MRKTRNDGDRFTIGELSRLTGIGIETIRYYERIGLLPRTPRTHGGHRAFGTKSCRSLNFIKRSRELGFALEDIRSLLSLRDLQGTCIDVRTIAARHLEGVRAKLRHLQQLEGVLAKTIARCPGDTSTQCPVLDSLDDASCCAPSESLAASKAAAGPCC